MPEEFDMREAEADGAQDACAILLFVFAAVAVLVGLVVGFYLIFMADVSGHVGMGLITILLTIISVLCVLNPGGFEEDGSEECPEGESVAKERRE